MIYASRSQLKDYLGLSKNLDTAISYLLRCDLEELRYGRNEVDHNRVFINRFDYETVPGERAFFEAHESYADIHLLLSGEEIIGVSDPAHLTEFDRNLTDDFIGYRGETDCSCRMDPQRFLIAFPGEAHMVKVRLNGAVHVRKAVVKVLM